MRLFLKNSLTRFFGSEDIGPLIDALVEALGALIEALKGLEKTPVDWEMCFWQTGCLPKQTDCKILGKSTRATTTTSAFISGSSRCHISSTFSTSPERRDNISAVKMSHQMCICLDGGNSALVKGF